MVETQITEKDLAAALPDTSETVNLRRLGAAAEIYRDGYGIPHVRAASVHDAFFAQGYAVAQDRLWHMDYDRRRACGRWAELAGAPGVEQDTMMRRFRLEASARADYDTVGVETLRMLDAYADGVNAFIETTSTLPVEYTMVEAAPERWQPWDSLAIFKVRHIFMGVFESKLWRARLLAHLGPEATARLYPGYEGGQLLILPPQARYSGPVEQGLEELSRAVAHLNWLNETDSGSNSWVLAGSRTASGKPLLAGDPHRALEVPNVYYQNHLACPEFDVVGLSFPGVPGFPHFGHNAFVAWCVTHAYGDYQDLFVERFNAEDPGLYEFKGELKRSEVYHETIHVRGGAPVEMDVTVTHHGPIVAGDPKEGYGIALRYTATAEPLKAWDALVPMLRAGSADELDEAMRPWVDPANNFLFADVHDNIGYLTRGQIPVRSEANAWVPVPGWTGEHEWEGYVLFEAMPRSRNPESGFIVTANNKITTDDYPHYIGLEYAPGFRAERVTGRLLDLGKKATVEDMASVHADMVAVPAQRYVRLLEAVEAVDEASARAKEILSSWDGTMERDQVAPTIYSAFRDSVVRQVLGPILGPVGREALDGTGRGGPAHVGRLKAWFPYMAETGDSSLLPDGLAWNSVMARALSEAVGILSGTMGDDMDAWHWGKLHRTRPQHTLYPSFPHLAGLLNPPAVPMGGDGDTPQAAGYSPGESFAITGTSVARYVFDLSDWSNSRWIVPLGASGHPGSPHFADQAPIWAEVQLVPMLYDWDRIAGEAESRQSLLPDQG